MKFAPFFKNTAGVLLSVTLVFAVPNGAYDLGKYFFVKEAVSKKQCRLFLPCQRAPKEHKSIEDLCNKSFPLAMIVKNCQKLARELTLQVSASHTPARYEPL